MWLLVILLLGCFIAIEACIIVHVVHVEVEVVELDILVNVPAIAPVARRLKLIQLHELLDCLCGSIILP